jgi:general secretion pathway protein G
MQMNLKMKTQLTDKRVRVTGKSRRGFTLVEMLLVLVILGVLAAIVYPKVAGRGEQARQTATQSQIAAFKTALDAFEVDNGYYPKGRNGLLDLVQKPRDATNWRGPYLESIPKDPWGNEYSYEQPGKHNPDSYDIMSVGPDGRPNTEDDIGNWQPGK